MSVERFEPILEVLGWSIHFHKSKTTKSLEDVERDIGRIWAPGASVREDERGVYIVDLADATGETRDILDMWYDLFLYLQDNVEVWKTHPGTVKLNYFDTEGNLQTIEERSPSHDLEDAVASLIEEAGGKFEERKKREQSTWLYCVECGDQLEVEQTGVNVRVGDWIGYFRADLYMCPGCGYQLLTGFGKEIVVAEEDMPEMDFDLRE